MSSNYFEDHSLDMKDYILRKAVDYKDILLATKVFYINGVEHDFL